MNNSNRFVDLSDNNSYEDRFKVLNMRIIKKDDNEDIKTDSSNIVKNKKQPLEIRTKRSKRGKVVTKDLDLIQTRRSLRKDVSDDIASKMKDLEREQKPELKAIKKLQKTTSALHQ